MENSTLSKEAFIPKGLKNISLIKAKRVFNTFVDKGLKQAKGREASPERVWQGLKEHANKGSGPDSLIAWPFIAGANKLFGKEKVRDVLWNRVGKPAMTADIALGRVGQKIPLVGKKLFTENVKVPWNAKKGIYKDIQRASALAPLTKVKGFAEPIVMMAAAEKGMSKLKEMNKQPSTQQNYQGLDKMRKTAQMSDKLNDRALREKVASAMVTLSRENEGHKKRAHATRLLFQQVELGREEVPHSYGEFEEKIASLVGQDLSVLEKALELIGGQEKLGELGTSADPSAARTTSERFQVALLDSDEVL